MKGVCIDVLIAALADIHANLHALQSVYQDIEKMQVDLIVCAGDLVGYGPNPNEVVEFLRGSDAVIVKGNYDDGIARTADDCGCRFSDDRQKALGYASVCWTNAKVKPENKEYLGHLPLTWRGTVDGKRILVVHGSPVDPLVDYMDIDRDVVELREIACNSDADIIIFGHTHIPYHLTLEGVHLINVGSVGRPKDHDPRACYALIEVTLEDIKVEFRRVSYDVEKVARQVVDCGLPPEFAEILKKGTTAV
ncbi:MAG: metallophosphoesterase family protein [Syntrophomonadaceae bacterium]|nr:metallophosphoesterase family protein [Syntrophomonadaceae bacterium]